MEYTISTQPTPNPNALKFVLNTTVRSRDSISCKEKGSSGGPLADRLLDLPGVREVYLASNFVTVTQDGSQDWEQMEALVKSIILAGITAHDPDLDLEKLQPMRRSYSQELAKVDAILESTVRPALQRDGGDLELVALEGNVLTIRYQGACGSCGHSSMGTLYAIQSILRDQYNPELRVEMEMP